jgi:glycosyltransferase involved in cell wall biosynthesis
MTVYLVDIEAVDTRYTKQWKEYLPKQMRGAGLDVVVITGGEVPQATTPGAFLNFAGTNNYKSQQMLEISRMFAMGDIKNGDYFLYTDAWNPTVIQLKYMSELLNIKIKIGGLWHAGSYDKHDFLGRLIGDTPWVRNAESSMFYCYDDNFFATRFHANLFLSQMFGVEPLFTEDELEEWQTTEYSDNPKIHIVGWPMEYLKDTMKPFANIEKKNKIIFPHRLAPEKQLDIFKDLAKEMLEYEWFVAQESTLTKDEYHHHLAESKIVFSANLQETLGISMYEGALVGTMPLVPDRLSYSEMWEGTGIKYPSDWTKDWDSYVKNKHQLMDKIRGLMETNQPVSDNAKKHAAYVGNNFFDGKELYKVVLDSTI